MRLTLLLTTVLVYLSACQKLADASIGVIAPQLIATPSASQKDWRNAINGAFTQSKVETDYGGVTEFTACFKKSEGQCLLSVAGRRNPFRKVMHFTPYLSSSNTMGDDFDGSSNVGTYVALQDCRKPLLFVTPTFSSKNSWIFINSLSILVDGEIGLEKELSVSSAEMDTLRSSAKESTNFVFKDADFPSLRTLLKSRNMIVRLSGINSYSNLKKEDVENFRISLTEALEVIDILNAATTEKLSMDCAAAK